MSRLKFIKNKMKCFVRHKRRLQLPSQQSHCPATTLDCNYFSTHCKIEVDNGQLLLFLVFVLIKFDPRPHYSTTPNHFIFPKSNFKQVWHLLAFSKVFFPQGHYYCTALNLFFFSSSKSDPAHQTWSPLSYSDTMIINIEKLSNFIS